MLQELDSDRLALFGLKSRLDSNFLKVVYFIYSVFLALWILIKMKLVLDDFLG